MRDLWRLLVWSQRYDRRHLGEALDAISARGRQVVKCRSLRDVLARTSGLPAGVRTSSP